MASFPLKIVCPDGVKFDGQAQQLSIRTTSGELGILARHTDCVAPLGMGRATIVTEGKKLYAACIGGILSVVGGEVKLVPTTFEWAESIDAARAQLSQERAEKVLKDSSASSTAMEIWEPPKDILMTSAPIS